MASLLGRQPRATLETGEEAGPGRQSRVGRVGTLGDDTVVSGPTIASIRSLGAVAEPTRNPSSVSCTRISVSGRVSATGAAVGIVFAVRSMAARSFPCTKSWRRSDVSRRTSATWVAEVAARASYGPVPLAPQDVQRELQVIAELRREDPLPTFAIAGAG